MKQLPNFILDDGEIQKLRRHLKTPDGTDISGLGNIADASSVRINPPYDFTHKFVVKKNEIGMVVGEMLHKRFPFRSVSDWNDKMISRDILVNGKSIQPEYILFENDQISHRNIGVVEPSVPDDIRIIFDCDDYLIIDKPAPIPMHSGGRYHRNTVVKILEDLGYPDLKIVHRLDAVTSGLVILAKNDVVANQLSVQFEQKNTTKTYEAIVRGNPTQHEVTIDKGIKRLKGFVFACSDDFDAKKAITRVCVLRQGDGWAHVSCEPVTGRTHQIRLHLAHWGHPIWDDDIYNGNLEHQSIERFIQKRAISLVSVGLTFESN